MEKGENTTKKREVAKNVSGGKAEGGGEGFTFLKKEVREFCTCKNKKGKRGRSPLSHGEGAEKGQIILLFGAVSLTAAQLTKQD